MSFFSVQFGGRGSRQSGSLQSENTTEQIVYTPASIFARMRKNLESMGLVRKLVDQQNLHEIRPGGFVEFEAALRRSPVIELLSVFQQFVPLMGLLDGNANEARAQSRNCPKNRGNQRANNNGPSNQQLSSLLSAMNAGNSEDLVAQVGDINVVLTTEKESFVDPTMNDVIDGTFRIFGKVTRVIPSDSDAKISLLRKSVLGKFGDASMLQDNLNEIDGLNFNGSLENEIRGPAMQVIPIAIYS